MEVNLTELEGGTPKTLNESLNLKPVIPPPLNIKECKNQVILGLIITSGYIGLTFISLYTMHTLFYLFKMDHTKQFEYKQITWMVNLLPVVGAVAGGLLTSYFGRKIGLILGNIPLFFVLALAFSNTNHFLWSCIIQRGCYLVATGIFNLIAPIYLCEILHPEIRAKITLTAVVYQLLAELVFNLTRMRITTVLVLAGIHSIVFMVLLIWKGHESPYWLISKWKKDEATEILKWFYGIQFDTERKIKEIAALNRNDKKSYWKHLISRKTQKPLWIILVLIFFQTFSGESTVLYHNFKILFPTNFVECLAVSLALAFTVVAILVVNRLKKKGLLLISAMVLIIALTMKGIVKYVQFTDEHDRLYNITASWNDVGYILFSIGYSFGFLYMPWIIVGELLPHKTKEFSAAISWTFYWFCRFLVSQIFHYAFDTDHIPYAYGCFACIMVLSMPFVFWWLPETYPKSLEEIEANESKEEESEATSESHK